MIAVSGRDRYDDYGRDSRDRYSRSGRDDYRSSNYGGGGYGGRNYEDRRGGWNRGYDDGPSKSIGEKHRSFTFPYFVSL